MAATPKTQTDDRICAVVGLGPGMGMALARRFGREGYAIATVGRRATRLRQHTGMLVAEGIRAVPFVGDAADRKSIAATFQSMGQNLGAPEVLIYNASMTQTSPPTLLTELDLIEGFRVNVIGALNCVRQVVADMRYKGRGTILFSGGGSAIEPPHQVASLGIGKAGLRNLCFSLAKELVYYEIHVATVTIQDHINPGTHFDPDRIADCYWELHTQSREHWQREVVYK